MKYPASTLLPIEHRKLLQDAATIPETTMDKIREIDTATHKIKQAMPHLFQKPHPTYLCGCGNEYPMELGKFGCPACCGTHKTKIVEE